MGEKVELYKYDYVILTTKSDYKDFLRFESGEIIIYDNLQEAHKDSKIFKGCTAVCTGIFPVMQNILIENIRTHRLRRNNLK